MAYVKALVHVPVLPQVLSSILSALIFLRIEGCFEINLHFEMVFSLVEIQLNPFGTYSISYYTVHVRHIVFYNIDRTRRTL